MKKFINSLALSVMLFFIVYLLASFYSMSFDITKWSEAVRGVVSVMGGFFSLVFGALYLGVQNDKL